MDDQGILNAINQGENKTVLKELYNQAMPSISKFIRSHGGTKEDAEDCFQESVIGLIVAVKHNRFNPDYAVVGYLFGVARNKWYQEAKRRGNFVQEIDRDHAINEEPAIIGKEYAQTIKALFSSLGENCAQLLKLVIYENKKHSEIAKIMSFNNQDVAKASYYRCKKKLREKVKDSPSLIELLRNG